MRKSCFGFPNLEVNIMKKNKTLVITTGLCLLPMLFALTVYNKLPDKLPIHWSSDGTPNDYALKPFVVFGMPLILAGLNLIIHISMDNDPKRLNASPFLRVLSKWLVPVVALVCEPISFLWALEYKLPVEKITPLIVGVFIILFGNYLPKSKQSYTLGIKLPWTLNSTENWNRTHHMAGYLWILGGIAIILNCFLPLGFLLPVIVVIMIAVPFLYSFYLYKKDI